MLYWYMLIAVAGIGFGWLAVRRGEFTLLANFARIPVHVPRERAEEVILATHSPTLEPGFVVLPALSGALVR